jgi:hypothetical protein
MSPSFMKRKRQVGFLRPTGPIATAWYRYSNLPGPLQHRGSVFRSASEPKAPHFASQAGGMGGPTRPEMDHVRCEPLRWP